MVVAAIGDRTVLVSQKDVLLWSYIPGENSRLTLQLMIKHVTTVGSPAVL